MASLRRLVLAPLFRLAFGHRNQIVLFQNDSDPQALRAMGALPKATRCVFTKGPASIFDIGSTRPRSRVYLLF